MTTTDHIRFQVLTPSLWLLAMAVLLCALMVATAQELRPIITVRIATTNAAKFSDFTNSVLTKVEDKDKLPDIKRDLTTASVSTSNSVTTYRFDYVLRVKDSNAVGKLMDQLDKGKDTEIVGDYSFHFCPVAGPGVAWLGCDRDPRAQHTKNKTEKDEKAK